MPLTYSSGQGAPTCKIATYGNRFITPIIISSITSTVAGQIVVVWSGGLGNNVKYSYSLSAVGSTINTASTSLNVPSAGQNTTTLTLGSTASIATTVTITGTVLDGSGSATSGSVTTLTPFTDVTGWTISMDLSSSTVPTTEANGATITKIGNPTMYNDATRGYVLTITASDGLSVPLTLATRFTITCWVKIPGNSTSGGGIWQFPNTGAFQTLAALYIEINHGSNGSYWGTAGVNSIANKFTVGTEWNFFALRWDGSTIDLYKNGTIMSNQTITSITGHSTPQSTTVRIGQNDGTEYVSNFRIYPSTLTPSQITNLYNYQLK